MKEIKNDIIKKYQYKGYFIYIKETNDSYEYYLQNEDYGVIALIFGLLKNKYTFKDFMKIVNNNIEYDIDYYKQEYED